MESPIKSNPTRWWRDRDFFPMSRTHILLDDYTQVLSALHQSHVAARLFLRHVSSISSWALA